jgi:hypothetical protein
MAAARFGTPNTYSGTSLAAMLSLDRFDEEIRPVLP